MANRFLSTTLTLLLAVLGFGLTATPASAAGGGAVSCRIPAGKSACTTAFLPVTSAGILHITTSDTGGQVNVISVTDIYTLKVVYGNGFVEVGDTSAWVGGLTNTYYGRLAGPAGAVLWIANY
jgi:hypothetical protein